MTNKQIDIEFEEKLRWHAGGPTVPREPDLHAFTLPCTGMSWRRLPRTVAPLIADPEADPKSSDGLFAVFDGAGEKMTELNTPMFLEQLALHLGAQHLARVHWHATRGTIAPGDRTAFPDCIVLAEPGTDLYGQQLTKLIQISRR